MPQRAAMPWDKTVHSGIPPSAGFTFASSLDILRTNDETGHVQTSFRSRRRTSVRLLLILGLAIGSGGCGALLLVGGAGTSAIAFATGELRVTEDVPLSALDTACLFAVERLAYEDIRIERDADRVRFRARTPGGEPVDLRLLAKGPEKTDLRIRIGTFGDESTSRLVLEEIHQSL